MYDPRAVVWDLSSVESRTVCAVGVPVTWVRGPNGKRAEKTVDASDE